MKTDSTTWHLPMRTQNSLLDDILDAEFRLSHAWVTKHTRSGLCYTISSAQGRTIFGELGIFDTDHPRWSLRHLYTALSRATAAALLSIES